jgi:hypothetical protein
MSNKNARNDNSESGNILLIILLAIVLIGALSVALQGSGQQNATIDKETLVIRIAEVQRHGSEVERGVNYVLRNGKSELDIRFSYPDADADYGDLNGDSDKTDQVFAKDGGAANYRFPPRGINDDSKWEFYGDTVLPEVGSDEPELIAVLPNVSQEFCEGVNRLIGYDSAVQPLDTGSCLNAGSSARFNNANQFSGSPNTVNDASFTRKPAMQGCVKCDDNTYHFFHVLLAR